ncbi:MAG: ATP-binding protein [Caldilineaceae bacterium]
MTSRLWVKLTGMFALVIVIGIAVTVLLARQGTEARFAHFMVSNHMLRPDRLQLVLADYYQTKQSWTDVQRDLPSLIEIASDGAMQGMMGNMMGMFDNQVIVIDSTGQPVASTTPHSESQIADEQPTQRWPILVDNVQVGEIAVMGMLMTGVSSRGQSVVEGVTRAVLLAGLVSGFVALLAAGLFVRQITHPLTQLSEAATQIAEGNLSVRATVHSKDEVAALAHNFNRMAESLEKQEIMRRTLMSDIAHELRTPLTAIQGTVEALQDGVFAADTPNLQAIHDQVMGLNHLVEELRTLASADAGQLALDYAEFNLVDLCQRRVTAFQAQATLKTIRLTCSAAEAEIMICADLQRLGQVLNNLLANALRHTPNAGTVQVTVGCEQEQAHLAIADTGEGIAAEDLPHIFDRFYRADHSRARETGGTGLGLAIVQQLVLAHGGKIWVESQSAGENFLPKQATGSVFHILLPLTPPTR